MSVRRIGVVTVGRSDFGIYGPVLAAITSSPDLDLGLYVTGMHLSEEHGMTVTAVEASGFPIIDRLDTRLSADTPAAIAEAMGAGTSLFARSFERDTPDILLVLGDRFEMHAAVVASVPFLIPVAHLHGGEITEGAFDDALRHSITKLSHLHFTSTELAARRVRAMGEAPDRVFVTGAPALDRLASFEPLDRRAIHEQTGLPTDGPFLLVTYHPASLEPAQTAWQIAELLAAVEAVGLPTLFTTPNADTSRRTIRLALDAYAAAHTDSRIIDYLEPRAYFSVLREASVMVGNSSSGIIEAASFGLPVVNVGTRQAGRERSANVIDVTNERAAIEAGLRRALEPAMRESLASIRNVYGDGGASDRIVEALRAAPPAATLLRKRFAGP